MQVIINLILAIEKILSLLKQHFHEILLQIHDSDLYNAPYS